MLPVVREMFANLTEPRQVLTPTSDRPLVIHHEMAQMTLVDSGSGHISIDGWSAPLSAGDLFVIAPNSPHAFRCTGGELHLLHWHWPQHLLHVDREILQARFDFGPEDLPGESP